MTTAAVRFAGVTKRYGSAEVLRQVDLELAAERTTAIVGESGSGKSTLLQLINGLVRADAGIVEVLGSDLEAVDLLALRRRIGYAVQGSALFPHLDLTANVTLLARLLGWSSERMATRLGHLLELMELAPELAHRYPHELSGGQQQRASLCRAMMLEPPLLLLDEPFSAVDPITRVGIHAHFERLAASEPVTVVLVTHDLREAVKLASDLVILRNGSVAQAGPCDEVIAAPADAWIERLFRSQLG
ncbi:MAG: ATP-binding cassette domain-containing protein [Gammaproteobacteria bacterium]|nr:MAG: ATP-binding cassette domain-containing protein [Gammaproteobacteria bacterium]